MEIISNNAVISIFSLLVGVVATVIVARYYFLRTLEKSKKELTPYLDYFSELLEGINPEVRESLSIKYQEIEVEDLIEVQYLIANSGEKPIRDLITPLILSIPDASKIVNASILHISPEGRAITLETSKEDNTVKFLFNLLNKDEFFVVKLLLNGKVEIEDFKFTITVDDLPPQLETKHLPYDLIQAEDGEETSEIEWGLLLSGVLFIFIGAMVGYFAQHVAVSLPEMADKPLITYIIDIPLMWFAKWPTLVAGVLILLLGIIMMVGAVSDANLFNKKKKLILPNDLIRSRRYSFPIDIDIDEIKDENAEAEKS